MTSTRLKLIGRRARRFTAILAPVAFAISPCLMAHAAALSVSTIGCRTPADAAKAAALRAKKDMAGLEAMSKPLIASGACTALAKGVTLSVDEKRLPLSCVRLTGDLGCYWVPDAFIDLYPSQGGAGGGRQRGNRHP